MATCERDARCRPSCVIEMDADTYCRWCAL